MAMIARVKGEYHPETVPSSVQNKNGVAWPSTLKSVLLALYTVPLGEPVPEPEAGGIVITSDCGCPEAMYVVDRPLVLSENHHGPDGLVDIPQGFTRLASVKDPTALMSEVR
jgi:hypothetical protein